MGWLSVRSGLKVCSGPLPASQLIRTVDEQLLGHALQLTPGEAIDGFPVTVARRHVGKFDASAAPLPVSMPEGPLPFREPRLAQYAPVQGARSISEPAPQTVGRRL